jgi:hypothetical protein
MPPFFIIAILLIVFLPKEYKYFSSFVIIVFWVVYQIWDIYAKKKGNSNNI